MWMANRILWALWLTLNVACCVRFFAMASRCPGGVGGLYLKYGTRRRYYEEMERLGLLYEVRHMRLAYATWLFGNIACVWVQVAMGQRWFG